MGTSLDWRLHYLCDTKFVKSEFSPPNFDWMVEQQKLGCEWFKKAQEIYQSATAQEGLYLKPELFPHNAAIVDDLSRNEINVFLNQVEDFRRWTDQRNDWRAGSVKSELDLILIFFAPVLLAVAFAIRLTKVTAEVSIAREKAQNAAAAPVAAEIECGDPHEPAMTT